MAILALSRSFLDQFHKLEPRARRKVSEHANTFDRLSATELRVHKGLNLERHSNAADGRARTIRIDDNHRGIVMDVGNNEHFVLTMVGTHDETDRWMANNTFKVNAATGALEVVDVAAIEAEATRLAATGPGNDAALLFAHRRDRDFVKLGIDGELVPALRALSNDDQLSGLLGILPEAQAEALIQLTSDLTVEQIYADIAGNIDADSIDVNDVAAALEAPASRSRFHVVEGQQELLDILSQPLAQWRVFLHPSQHELAYRERYSGPARVTGGAGTGKTVVAIHRARFLADGLPPGAGRQVLFTTYTRNLAQAIEADLLHLGGTRLLESVEVANVDRIAFRIVQEAEGVAPKLATSEVLNSLWENVIDEEGLDFSASFLSNEWDQIVLAQGLESRSAYFRASRAGRGIGLDRRRRAQVWLAIERVTQRLNQRGLRTHLQIADAATGYLSTRAIRPYRHVIVDEAQDLHESQWRMLRALAEPATNDLFIVGDAHQRIYDHRSSLKQVDIKIQGRSKKLTINYRTTYEILRWSMKLLGVEDFTFDDLDGEAEHQTFAGYHCFRRGPEPTMSGHRSLKEQHDAMVDVVKQWIADGVEPEAIGIAARSSGSLNAAEDALTAAAIDTCRLPQRDLPNQLGVRLGTMHRMKGLEFPRVAIVDAGEQQIPPRAALTDRASDSVQHAVDLQRECCVLYVAATRARDELWVGWSGKPSRYLQSPP